MSKTGRCALFAALVLGSACLPASAQSEVGRFAVVQNHVSSLRPGTTEPVPVQPGIPIMLNEREATCKDLKPGDDPELRSRPGPGPDPRAINTGTRSGSAGR